MDLMSRFALCRCTHVGKYKVLILKHSLFWFHSRREPLKCSGVFLWRAIAQEQGNVMQAFPQMSLHKSVLAYFLSIGPPPPKRWHKCEKDFFSFLFIYYKYHSYLSCIFIMRFLDMLFNKWLNLIFSKLLLFTFHEMRCRWEVKTFKKTNRLQCLEYITQHKTSLQFYCIVF